jgi:hypothetical protein
LEIEDLFSSSLVLSVIGKRNVPSAVPGCRAQVFNPKFLGSFCTAADQKKGRDAIRWSFAILNAGVKIKRQSKSL